MKTIKIGGTTVNQTPFDWNGNTANILASIEEAKVLQVEILSFPELSITGYGCEDTFLSNWLSERAWTELEKIRLQCVGITVCVGLPVRINNVTYNGACMIDDTEILGISFKQNLARDGVHYEPRWFQAWPSEKVITIERNNKSIPVGDLVYEIKGIKIGFEICEDAWRTIRPGTKLKERGVDLIINPSASHFAMQKSLLREELVRSSSEKFNCGYLFVNLLGNEAGRMVYDGDIIIAQHGRMIALNPRLTIVPSAMQVAEINFENPKETKSMEPVGDMVKNEEFAQAEALALFDYLRKSKAKGFVLSLSGGADSSLCAILVAEMVKRASRSLGWEKFCHVLSLDQQEINSDWKKAVNKVLTCAYQSTKNSSDVTFSAAKSLATSIGAGFHSWSIDEEVNSYTSKINSAIGRDLNWETDDITLQNIQARSRSPIIWMLANIKQAILLTTSNRSEGSVGYATMDGDTSGSLAPIAAVSKPFILQWLAWAQEELDYPVLKEITSQQPTAELRPQEDHQTDEDDLMPYKTLTVIERLAILEMKSPVEVFAEMRKESTDLPLLKKHIRTFFQKWSANQWKRERLAPSFFMDEFNVDPKTWCRFPILSSSFKEELAALDNF